MSEMNEIMLSLTQELRRGTIVLSVLSQLNHPEYGYTLVIEPTSVVTNVTGTTKIIYTLKYLDMTIDTVQY